MPARLNATSGTTDESSDRPAASKSCTARSAYSSRTCSSCFTGRHRQATSPTPSESGEESCPTRWWPAEATTRSQYVPTRTDSDLSLGDGLSDDSDAYEVVERHEWLRPALATLTDRERVIISLRFVDGLTQEQISRHLGVSQMQVSGVLAGIFGQLRDALDSSTSPQTRAESLQEFATRTRGASVRAQVPRRP